MFEFYSLASQTFSKFGFILKKVLEFLFYKHCMFSTIMNGNSVGTYIITYSFFFTIFAIIMKQTYFITTQIPTEKKHHHKKSSPKKIITEKKHHHKKSSLQKITTTNKSSPYNWSPHGEGHGWWEYTPQLHCSFRPAPCQLTTTPE